ncbi:mycothiol transferase [Corynebacterium halotolerans]|uniref:DinB-like domain-containing protein n=1 Tax=Corynebacterium halotolerans YIM 70093 = DSM 44683 TaxID=1121362 RepID=M1NNM7_9CORY|nr:DinB family protein [Corynebacterium halotolerans]AGF71087.1 hypothetical protein A605_00355 [Corynebacterium halotolerans YIM 70093 = DSM 44683]
MDANEVFRGFAERPAGAVDQLPELTPEQLNAHPAGHPNSVAWLLWHTGREIDVQLSTLNDRPQVWEESGFRERLNLGEAGDSFGYGHDVEQAAAIETGDQRTLQDYVKECLRALIAYAGSLEPAQWDEVIDHNWDPPVTRGVRLTSIVDDAVQHLGQAAYVAGMPEL